MPAPDEFQLADLEAVLHELAKYEGETITRNEHPLHLAVQRLERQCRPPRDIRWSSQWKLWQPACAYWFRCLWASRSGMPNIGKVRDLHGREPNPSLARLWAAALAAELTLWKTDWPTRHYHHHKKEAP